MLITLYHRQYRARRALAQLAAQQPLPLGLAAGLLIGLALGLIIGWLIWPVQWTGTFLSPAIYLINAADLYAFDHNQARLRWALEGWDYAPALCHIAHATADEALRWRIATVQVVTGVTCQ